MAHPVCFTEEAEKDLSAAAMWFANEAGVDLANRFIDLIETTVCKIGENPELYAVVYKDYRQVVIRPFLYVMTFRIKTERVEILAITHGGRDPEVWKRRG